MKLPDNRAFRFLLTVLLPLAAGVLIYLFCSPSARYFFQFFPEPSAHFPLWNWIAFSLPDGLWTFSFVSFALLIFHERNLSRNIFICITILAGPALEFLQLFHFIPGTFDVIDILLQCIAGAAALFCARSFPAEKKFYLQKFKTALALAGCFGFLVMAFANSPEEPPELKRSIRIVNRTGKPVHIIEKGTIDFRLDSGTGNFYANHLSADSGYYFLFAYNEISRYPGILSNGIRTTSRNEIKAWKNSYTLKSFDFSMDQTLLVPEDRRIYYRTSDTGLVDSVSFWLTPDHDTTFATLIPINDSIKFSWDEFPSYKILFTNRYGKPDSMMLSGWEFSKYLDTRGIFEIK